MPAVKVIRPFKRRGEVMKPGDVLSVAAADLDKLDGYVEPLDLHRMVGDYLAEVDRLGRPWPARFLVDMPAEDRDQLRELERQIDVAADGRDTVKLTGLLDAWRALLLRHLH